MLLWGEEEGVTKVAAATKARGKGAEQQMLGLLWAASARRTV